LGFPNWPVIYFINSVASSTWVPKDEPSDDDDSGDYIVFYRRLGMN
jgi:hypothetical protein